MIGRSSLFGAVIKRAKGGKIGHKAFTTYLKAESSSRGTSTS